MPGWLQSMFGLQLVQLRTVSLIHIMKHEQKILQGALWEGIKSEKSHTAMWFLSAETSYKLLKPKCSGSVNAAQVMYSSLFREP